jgi:isoleucyl-tRNA synthetase
VPGKTVESVHQLTWQPLGITRPDSEKAAWKALFELRELALPELEKARQAKEIGKALEAKLTFAGSSPALAAAQAHPDALRELLNVSQLEIAPAGEASLTISVSKAAGEKCERCWHWETDTGAHAEHPTICGRCVKAVLEGTKA